MNKVPSCFLCTLLHILQTHDTEKGRLFIMKCLIIDAVHSAIAEELSKYMQVDTHMLPTQEELL